VLGSLRLVFPFGIAVAFAAGAAAAADAQIARLPSLTLPDDISVYDGSDVATVSSSYVDAEAFDAAANRDDMLIDDAWRLQWLPEGLIFKSYLAGVKESRMAAKWVYDDHEGWFFDGTLGGRLGMLRYGTQDAFLPQGFQIDIEGSAQVRLDIPEEKDVRGTDYRVGVPLTWGFGRQQIKFAYYHISCHQGDEYVLKNSARPGYQRFNYARDAFVLGHSVYLTDDLRIYSEAAWAFRCDVAKPWEFQFGLDYAPGCATGCRGAPFIAVNGHLREELDFGGNLTVQAGWAWRTEEAARLLRLGLHYQNGGSTQFSFYNEHEQQFGVGIWYDY